MVRTVPPSYACDVCSGKASLSIRLPAETCECGRSYPLTVLCSQCATAVVWALGLEIDAACKRERIRVLGTVQCDAPKTGERESVPVDPVAEKWREDGE